MWRFSLSATLQREAEGVAARIVELERAWRRRRALRAAPVLARDLVVGARCRVLGIARADAPLRAPFSGTECAYFRVRLEQKIREEDGSDRFRWVSQIEEASTARLSIVDREGGSVLVDPTSARSELPEALVSEHPRVNDENPGLSSFLRSHGVLPTLYMGITGEYRFYETTVEPGQPVSAFGLVREERTIGASAYRAAAGVRVVLGSWSRPLLLLPAYGA